jgi:hypothetical protein
VQPGGLIDCGSTGGFRLAISSGADQGGQFGLPRPPLASRLTVQPAFAARNGILYMAWNKSDSPFFGDPSSHSNIMFIRSNNGGQTWTSPIQVNPTGSNDTQHVHDRVNTFPANRNVRVTGVASPLPPSNITLNTTTTTNYDRSIRPCYALGEYQSVESANGRLHVAWGDMRNTVQQPVNALDPISGLLHQQTDVFYQQVKAP